MPRDKPLPDGLPDATVIKVPLRSAVVYSDVYARPIVELGCGNAIVGVLDAQYFKTPEVVAGLKSGKISDCGSLMSPSTERQCRTGGHIPVADAEQRLWSDRQYGNTYC